MKSFICDIDGTIAIRGDRGPFEYERVLEDVPNKPVVELVRSLLKDKWVVIFVSGREDICRDDTFLYLSQLFENSFELYMRKRGDYRSDAEVKSEIFVQMIKPFHSPSFVLDDRDKTVRMWRDSHGLSTFQVADGDF
jgi:hypothetical protein